VNDLPVQPVFYSLTDYPGGRWTWEEMPRRNLSLFAEQGVWLFQADLMLEHVWTAEKSLDIGAAQRQIRGILDVCPAAAVVIRLHVNSPPWWNLAHPEECVGYADGPADAPPCRGIERPLDRDLERALRQSLASSRWREEAGAIVGELCRRLTRVPEGDSLIGVHVANGVFGEWGYFGFLAHEPDNGPAMSGCFREWLTRKYADDNGLRQAWGDPSASLGSAEVPGVEERRRTSDGVFRDPRRECRVIDYFECHQQAVTESLLHFCRIVKESWPRPILTGAFYGYLFSQFGRQAAGGHLEVARVLGSPWLDYLSGPQTYQPYTREIGGTGQSRGLLESCALHGKLWFDEMDQPTHLGSVGDKSYSCTLPDAVALLRRNVAHPLLRGHGLWYYDFGPRFSCGWWDDPVLIREIRRLKEVFDERMPVAYGSPADVLLVCDTTVFYHTGASFASDPVSEPATDRCSSAIYRTGACFHMAYLSDLERIDWPRYRAVVFANTWLLSTRQRAYIARTVAREGRHVVWVYAPGYSDGTRLSTELISETTGMSIERIELALPPSIPQVIEMESPVTPLFSARNDTAEVIERFEGTAFPAVARRERGDSTSWFCALPPTLPGLLRRIFRESGAHLYCQSDDVLFGGWGLLCIHTLDGGPREITLRGGKRIAIRLPPRSTTLIDAETGAVVIGGSDDLQ
jgi:hypothetical protein